MKKLLRSVFGVLITLIAPQLFATAVHAAEITWSGAGGDNNFSTTANWVGGVAPVDGDSIVIPAGTPRSTLANDSVTTLSGITLPSSPSGTDTATITGAFSLSGDLDVDYNRTLQLPDTTLTADITVNLEYSLTGNTVNGAGNVDFVSSVLDLNGHNIVIQQTGYVPLDADALPLSYNVYVPEFSFIGTTDMLVGAGSTGITLRGVQLTFASNNASNSTLASTITAHDSIVNLTNTASLGTATLVLNNSQLSIGDVSSTATKTVANDITFNGNLYGATFDANFAIGQSALNLTGTFDVVLSGDLVFSKDALFKVSSTSESRQVTLSGALSGTGIPSLDAYGTSYVLVVNGSSNSTQVPNGSYQSVTGPITLSDAQASLDVVVPYGDVVVNGSRRNVILSTGSRLKGTGTVGNLLVQTAGYLAPGLSPGCLATGNLTLAGTYEVEISGNTACTEYDRTNVTGTVTLSGSTLSITRTGATPALNTTYVIINNDGSDTVTGTFTGQLQGSTVTVSGVTYTISYTGGDGNDVVLTVTGTTAAVGTPNTGFSLIKSNLLLPLLAMVSGVSLLLFRRYALKK